MKLFIPHEWIIHSLNLDYSAIILRRKAPLHDLQDGVQKESSYTIHAEVSSKASVCTYMRAEYTQHDFIKLLVNLQ